ncbi:SURF1 family protein [Cupriavidus gilardii]|uniref:SURF1 family protein n=1 Tax=Cupriavidus gilardii TaxID=82541 RepID=UPI001580FC47|nr:SURF1 family protein [Cupriavidus gilardii]MCT9074718.1 SURF1 family protein [Cupriavidus gilardii]QKS62687.1 SURF1 family protein [Cupriavidus gilardii]
MTLLRALSPVPTVAALVVIAVTCALGNWQLGRAHDKIAGAERLRALADAAPLRIGTAPPPLPAAELVSRKIVVRGRFDPAHTVLLENRPHGNGQDSRSGFLVLTPLRPDDAAGGGDTRAAAGTAAPRAVLVLRGWLPRDAQDRTRIAPFPTPEGTVTLQGVALADVPKVYQLGSPDAQRGERIRQNLDLGAFAAELGTPLQPFVLQQRSDSGDGLARDWASADLGVERHYGYAFQWYGLAALTLVLLVALTWRRARRLANPADAGRGAGTAPAGAARNDD